MIKFRRPCKNIVWHESHEQNKLNTSLGCIGNCLRQSAPRRSGSVHLQLLPNRRALSCEAGVRRLRGCGCAWLRACHPSTLPLVFEPWRQARRPQCARVRLQAVCEDTRRHSRSSSRAAEGVIAQRLLTKRVSPPLLTRTSPRPIASHHDAQRPAQEEGQGQR